MDDSPSTDQGADLAQFNLSWAEAGHSDPAFLGESRRHHYQGAVTRGMRLAGPITGVPPTDDQVNAPLPSTSFDHVQPDLPL